MPKNHEKRGSDVLTGPRKRTLQLTTLCMIGLVFFGGTAESSKTRRSGSSGSTQRLTHPAPTGVRAKKLHSTSVKTKQKALQAHRVKDRQRVARAAPRNRAPNRARTGDRGRVARGAIRGPTRAAVRAGSSRRVSLAHRAPAGTPSLGPLIQARRNAWLSQRWRQGPANLNNPPAIRPAPDPIHEALKQRAARLAAARPEGGSGLLTGGPDAIRSDAPNRDLVAAALAARGIRYRWGGASRGGFDCSGFTRWIFAQWRGVALPHSASRQANHGEKVSRDALQPGDLLFFRTSRRGISHVGIYIGENRFVHAANRRKHVRVDELTGYYANRYVTARRVRARVSPPAMPGRNDPSPAGPDSLLLEEPEPIHPDEITVLKLDPEADAPLARGGEPISASRAGPPATDVEPES